MAHRRTAAVLLVGVLCVPLLAGQATQSQAQSQEPSSFEVAAVKPNKSGSGRSGTEVLPGGRVTVTNKTLRSLIPTAYGAPDTEVIGGPGWLDSDRWDMTAVAPPDARTAPWQPMLKSLLIERFQLQAHIEQREQPIYRLVLAKGDKRLGPNLRVTECKADDARCGYSSTNSDGIKRGTMDARGRDMAQLSSALSPYVERRVFDQTGLEGRYDLQLEWSEDLSFFTALEEQLGLKVQSDRGPIDVLVVDRAERPVPD